MLWFEGRDLTTCANHAHIYSWILMSHHSGNKFWGEHCIWNWVYIKYEKYNDMIHMFLQIFGLFISLMKKFPWNSRSTGKLSVFPGVFHGPVRKFQNSRSFPGILGVVSIRPSEALHTAKTVISKLWLSDCLWLIQVALPLIRVLSTNQIAEDNT